MTHFTERRKQELKRNGFVVMQDMLDETTVEAAREEFWSGVDFERDDYDVLLEAPERFENAWEHIEDPEPFAAINDELFPYAEALAGEDTLDHPGEGIQVAPRFPTGDQRADDERPPLHRERGHIDGYGPQFEEYHEVGHYTVMATVYLDRVEPRGGGFTVWPGSHWYARKYFEDHHLESLVDNATLPRYEDGEWRRGEALSDQIDPLEIHGEAGTVVFWHQNLLHAGGVNNSPYVRLAAIQRFTRPDSAEIKREAFANPWQYWGGMEDIELP